MPDTELGYVSMKNKWKKNVLWLMAIVAMTTLTGCPGGKQEPQPESQPELKDLVVVTQTDSVSGIHEENSTSSATITLDAPVEGPQVLVESVMELANNELYAFCEYCVHFDEDITSFSKEEVYTNDGAQLLNHYMEKYKPLIQDSVWNVFDRTLAMEAQTDLFVTYGVENFHCGASCGSEKYYYTFDKKDGHQVGDIINHENLVRFFEEHPECATIEESEENPGWTFDAEDEFENTQFGLLSDNFILVVVGVGNHYMTKEIPYSLIGTYLSPEVQTMMGLNK